MSTSTTSKFVVPACVGDYRLEPTRIGEGSDAFVLRATHIPTGQRVAVKVRVTAPVVSVLIISHVFVQVIDVAGRSDVRNRVLTEVAALSLLSPSCPNVIGFLGVEERRDKFFMFMELAHQGMLVQGRFPFEVTKLLVELTRFLALFHCYRFGIFHSSCGSVG